MPRARSRKLPAHHARRRPPFFHPVPLRSRRDGWSIARQCQFLAQLYVTGSVSAAALSLSMSRASAYRLRAREGAEGFAFAWDHVLTGPGTGRRARLRPDLRKVTLRVLVWWLETGMVQPVMFHGRVVGIRSRPCNTSLFAILRRGDASERRVGPSGSYG